MMKKKLLLSLAVLMGLTSAMATEEITCSDFNISRGETKAFGIQFSNEGTNYVGFQMDLTLPEGLTINKAGCSLSARITDEDQELTIGKQSDNTYRLTSTSLSLTPISGTSGDLITVSVTASNTYESGNATINNIQFATSNSERVTMDDVALNINFAAISFADANVKAICVANWDTNGDGELDMSEAYAVTDLGEVFKSNSDITSFDELQYFTGLTSIGSSAFRYCTNLASIEIPNSVTNIGSYAFNCCSSLTSINIPNSVTTIGTDAFSSTGLISITIPNSVTSISQGVFFRCSGLTSVSIPNSVTSIGMMAFENCSNLNTIIIPNSVTSIGDGAFSGCSSLTSIEIPSSVTSIGESAFEGCSDLTSISIPESVTNIGDKAFSGCSDLTSITVDSENTIYDSQNNCNAIIEKTTNTLIAGCQNTVIPNSVTTIGSAAFSGCSGLTSIEIPNSVESIGDGAFSGCSGLTSIEIPSSVTSIGERAFYGCSGLTSIEIPSSVTSIGERAFYGCSGLTSIEIPSSMTSINQDVFIGCISLTSITIPNSVTSIGDGAFWGCSGLTSITIPNSVTNIGWASFGGCTALAFVNIGNNVTSIGERAFEDCNNLTSVVINISSPLTINYSTFNTQNNATLYVPKNCKTAYAAADYWNEFKAIKEFPDPDVNQDGYVDVVDVVDVARFVIGTPSESFDQFLADLNSSGEVNVADAVVLVNEIAGDVNWARAWRAPAISNDILTLTRNADQSLSFSLEGNSAYTAFQFDLMMPEGMDVTQLTLNSERKQNHQLLYNKIGEGHYRVVALSTSNNSFNGTTGELLNVVFDGQPADGVVIDNIHFVTAQGNDQLFSAIGISGDTPTSISGVRSNAAIYDGRIYNLNGQRLTKAQKGLYIINGRKVVVK